MNIAIIGSGEMGGCLASKPFKIKGACCTAPFIFIAVF